MMRWITTALRAASLAAAVVVPAAFAATPGVSDATITLGMSAPFSGPNAVYGSQMKEAIGAYFERVNQAGGVNGRRLELVALDDGYESARTVANTRTLIDDRKVFALLGYYGSTPTTEAMDKVFGPARVPLIGALSGAGTLRAGVARNPNERYMFNLRASYAAESATLVHQITSLGLKNIAVFYQDDGFGQSGLDGVTRALKARGLTLSAAGSVPRNSLDVDHAVAEIAKVTPQAVVMVTLYKPTAKFVQAMKARGQHPMYLTLSPVGGEVLARELGDDARGIAVSQVMPFPWSERIAVVRDYQRLLGGDRAKFSYAGLEGYMEARLLVDALQRAGRDLSRDKLVATLESMQHHDLDGYAISFGPEQREGSRFVEMTALGTGGKVLH